MTESIRLKKFHTYQNHPWYNRIYKRLKSSDIEIATQFIRDHDHLDRGAFEFKINRFFIDKEKPRLWREITELLTVSNL